MARPLRREGGKGRATKKKELFLKLEKNVATTLERWGGKTLVAKPLKKTNISSMVQRALRDVLKCSTIYKFTKQWLHKASEIGCMF